MKEISEKEYKAYQSLVKLEEKRKKEKVSLFICFIFVMVGVQTMKTWGERRESSDLVVGAMFLFFAGLYLVSYFYQWRQEKKENDVKRKHNPDIWLKETRVIRPGTRPFWGFLCAVRGHLIVGFRVVAPNKARTIMETGENYEFSGEGLFHQCIRCGRVSTGFWTEPRDYDDPEVMSNMIWEKK